MEPIRVLIVDDHTLVRDGLQGMLTTQKDFTVVGEAENGLEAIERARELQPDIVLMDLRMPELDGVEAMRRIRAEDPQIKVIVLTTYDSDEYVFQAIEAGAKGYLLKDASREELFQAVRATYRGQSPFHSGVIARVLQRFAQLSHHTAATDVISEREMEVLWLMARGATNKEIAASLSISEGTARTHVSNILQKLGTNHRTEAVTKALEKGIIKL